MKELVIHIVKQLVDNPEKVKVKEIKGEQNIILELSTDKEDIGKVIGKQGRTIKALRTLLNAASVKTGHRVTLEVIK
ncbi:KH domain-containing protein [bacterium]|nr:KH domain-containing protein [bacterium]NIN92344.1 KH domain-containing protein [bacterium]NIO18458.1 KH domain-containing protein [bacterium]NIO73454.1 KH domain-containing protein [bacterium]